MLKRILFSIALILGIIAGAVAEPHLTVLPDGIVDLGEFEAREVQTREIYVKNTGDEPLTILKTFASCSCTRVKFPKVPIAPGDSVAMTVIFDGSDRKPGSVEKVFRITSNADNSIVGVLVTGKIVRPFQK